MRNSTKKREKITKRPRFLETRSQHFQETVTFPDFSLPANCRFVFTDQPRGVLHKETGMQTGELARGVIGRGRMSNE